jgi:polar amino acid transport system permease protein
MEFDWGYFFSLFSVGAFWQACITVIVVSSLSWFIGLVLGFLLACAKLSGPRWLKVPVELYIWFFRSVPLMVLLVFVYNLPQLFPVTQPLLGIPFIAGLVSMTVTEAAYMAEIHRGGLMSVAKGQSEAGHALSFSFIGIQRLIIIPQAFRISLPTLINEYITIIKLSSILSVISLPELLLTGQRLYAQNFLVMETLLAVAVYYVMVVTVFTWLFRALENVLDIQQKRPQTFNDAECDALRQSLKAPQHTAKAEPTSGNPPALDLRAIEKSWGQHQVLKGIDLKVENGQVISIIGPSGSGKTTLIRTINALESIDAGEIVLYGEDYLKGRQSWINRRCAPACGVSAWFSRVSTCSLTARCSITSCSPRCITSWLSSGWPESRPSICWIASACWPMPKNTPGSSPAASSSASPSPERWL